MAYKPPTLRIKYIKPAYLELANEGLDALDKAMAEGITFIPLIIGITGGVRAAVDSGEKLGAVAGEIYVKFYVP